MPSEPALYTVFIGSWDDGDPDWTTVRIDGLTWDTACIKLAADLLAFEDDDCPACRADAAEALERLKNANPGKFEAFVDGDDYMIIPQAGDNE